MPLLPPEPDLARLVAHRAQLSMHLLVSVRAALRDVGQTDLIPVLDLISRNAGDCYALAAKILAARRGAKRLRILAGLGRLSRLGGPKARTVIHRLAEDITTTSGSFPAYNPGD
jgi:hypothetical protein